MKRIGGVRLFPALCAGTLTLAACMPIQPAAPAAGAEGAAPSAVAALPRAATADVPLVVVQVSDDGISLPAEVPSGAVAFRLEGMPEPDPNTPPPGDTMEVVRPAEGVSTEQLTAAFQAYADEGSLEIVDVADFVGLTSAPELETIVDLTPGEWYISRSSAPGGALLQPFTVVETADPAEPEAGATLEYLDFAYNGPTSLAAGPQLWEFVNNGAQEHMVLAVRLTEELAAQGQQVAAEQVIAYISQPEPQGPPPFTFAGAFEPISEGMRAWVEFDLEPGTYLLVCPLPDVEGEMMPHHMLGMTGMLTVTEP